MARGVFVNAGVDPAAVVVAGVAGPDWPAAPGAAGICGTEVSRVKLQSDKIQTFWRRLTLYSLRDLHSESLFPMVGW
jgi:hypothetical protein